MDFQEIKQRYDKSVCNTYGRYDAVFVKGEDCTLYDCSGKAYIDFSSGIGVNSVGYAHPKWIEAVSGQASKLGHVSNLYYTLPGVELAERITKLSGMDKVFFCNSGAEANEGVIKCARKYSFDKYGSGRSMIVTLQGSFHGRTVTTLSATGQEHFHRYFHPFTEGFAYVSMGDISALESLGDDVCAVMLEPVQGEGGVYPCPDEYVRAVEKLCRQRDWLLILDEVQTGFCRTGSWFAFQKYGVEPDLVSFAKGIAGGMPLGGFLTAKSCSGTLTPGTHATTFGANPVCCAAALAVIDILEETLPFVETKGTRIRETLEKLPKVKEVRGMGLMLGIAVEGDPKAYVLRLLEEGLVCLTAGKDAIRLLPPLVIKNEDIDKGLEILKKVLQ